MRYDAIPSGGQLKGPLSINLVHPQAHDLYLDGMSRHATVASRKPGRRIGPRSFMFSNGARSCSWIVLHAMSPPGSPRTMLMLKILVSFTCENGYAHATPQKKLSFQLLVFMSPPHVMASAGRRSVGPDPRLILPALAPENRWVLMGRLTVYGRRCHPPLYCPASLWLAPGFNNLGKLSLGQTNPSYISYPSSLTSFGSCSYLVPFASILPALACFVPSSCDLLFF